MCLCTSECWSVKVMFWLLELHVPLDMFIMTTEYVVLYCSNQDIYCIVVQSVFFNINWDIICRSYSKTIRQIKVFHYMDRKNSIQMQLSNSLAYCCIVHNRLIQIRYISREGYRFDHKWQIYLTALYMLSYSTLEMLYKSFGIEFAVPGKLTVGGSRRHHLDD